MTAVLGLGVALAIPQSTHAGDAKESNFGLKPLGEVGSAEDLPFVSDADAGKKLPVIVGNIFRVLLSLLGVIFLILIVYGGIRWMIARGDSGEVETAKEIIIDAFIGLIIVVASFAIVNFVFEELIKRLGEGGTPT